MQITKYIPNTITSLNLACGASGLMFVGMGRIDIAFLLMLCGSVADFCDGLSARLLGAYSPMGKELDSLADQVSFGMLPAAMLSATMVSRYGYENAVCWIPLLIAVFSGLRLAKFNIDERQTSSFLGLPTPGCAMICGSLAYFMYTCPESAFAQFCGNIWFIPALSAVLCALLVSEIPMFSMKIHKGEGMNKAMVLRIIFAVVTLAAVACTCIMGLNWSIIPFTAFIAYIIINIASLIFAGKK